MQAPEIDPKIEMPPQSLYETDFYGWIQKQASLLQRREWHQVDVPNLIEELESLGKQQRQELRNRLSILIGHLLKWEYQPQNRSRSWLATIRIQRRDTLRLLKDNPSLKSDFDAALLDASENARDLAIGETDLPEKIFPQTCSYTAVEILDNGFFPGEPSELLPE